MSTPNMAIMMKIGHSQNFLRATKKTQSSLIIDMMAA